MESTPPTSCDVLVVGSGNAGFSAAISAAQTMSGGSASASASDPGPRVLLVDKCPESWAGGNSYFTAGAYRFAHDGLESVLPLVSNVTPEQAARIDLPAYTAADFDRDMHRVSGGRSDKALGRVLVDDSADAVRWLSAQGVRFWLSFNRQAYEVDGRIRFWGGLCVRTPEGGKSLVDDLRRAADRHGVRTFFSTALTALRPTASGTVATVVRGDTGERLDVACGSVVLAAGGFEASPRLRSQYLGPGWDLAYVRGTPHNTGDVLEMAVSSLGARAHGNWSGCHSVAWDASPGVDPHSGDRVASNEHTKSGYPLGLMLNVDGRRFVDEGVDLRNYTYAKFGRAILAQPESVAFQVWDARTSGMLRSEEYRPERAERLTSDTLQGLAEECASRGLRDKKAFVATVHQYNEAVRAHRRENPSARFDPSVKDGLSTQSSTGRLDLPKSNWALPLDEPPFVAVKVTCGVTFTFGGLQVDPGTAQVLSSVTSRGIPGVYCCGEMLGGLFYGNYPGGSGLTSGTVFGRRAGRAAAEEAMRRRNLAA